MSRFNLRQLLANALSPIVGSSILCGALALPSLAAEQLKLQAGPVSQTISVQDLAQFIDNGELAPELTRLRPLLTPQLRELLGQRLALEPAIAQQFLDDLLATRDGQRLLEELHQALPGSSPEQLEASLYLLLHNQEQGLTPLSLVQVYPQDTLTVDLLKASKIAFHLNRPRLQSQALRPVIERLFAAPPEQSSSDLGGFDPTRLGSQTVTQRSLNLYDQRRQRAIAVDLYYGEVVRGPMVVLSHGFAADRKFLAYLAEHLASYGFSVATLEHPGSNIDVLAQIAFNHAPTEVLSAAEFVDRPQDIQFVLNDLERRNQPWSRFYGKFNTEQVVVIGHSLGGYTALALAGAELDLRALRDFCHNRSPLGRAPADWLQCSAAKLPYRTLNFRDERVIQAVAMNPVVGQLFGQQGLQKLQTPVMLISHSNDTVTPTLEHQLLPFGQIPTPKQFVLISGATHMSITDMNNSNSPVAQSSLVQELMGQEVEPVRQTIRGLMLAVVSQQTEQAIIYRPFLTAAYAQSLSTDRFTVRLGTEMPPELVRWGQLLQRWGNEPDAAQLTWRDRLAQQWQTATQRWQPLRYCQGQLDNIFTRLFRQESV